MNIKEQLLKLRNRLTGEKFDKVSNVENTSARSISENIILKYSSSYDLEDKVDKFIEWYTDNMVEGYYTEIGKYRFSIEMRNFIEKMAVWYELRYPDYEINRLIPGSGQELKEISKVMFQDNRYINDLLDNNSEVRELDWDEFYNTHVFVSSLPVEERRFFTRPKYHNLKNGVACLQLTTTGIIQNVEMLNSLWLTDNERATIDKDFKGKHIEELVKFLKERASRSDIYKSLKEIVTNYNNQVYQKEEMLNCVMYRIIERGGNRIGPRRAFLFAKEFGRNIDIPMMYGVDRSDPGLKLFINEYIKIGGSKDLICYNGYFSRTSKKEKLDTISIQDLILNQNNDVATFYTPEEEKLHQRLVNALASQADQDILRKEEVKRLKLEKK